MSYRRFVLPDFPRGPATPATTATLQPNEGRTVATVAGVAGGELNSAARTVAIVASVAGVSCEIGEGGVHIVPVAGDQPIPATPATTATLSGSKAQTVATVARGGGETDTLSAADLAMAFEERAAILEQDAGLSRPEAERLARDDRDREAEWPMPSVVAAATTAPAASRPVPAIVSGRGVTVGPPAVEVSAADYDRHLDAMIAAAGEGSPEASRIAYAKRKGWVVQRGEGKIFTRRR